MSTLSGHLYASSRLSSEGQIRLLTVQPEADRSREIQCRLEIVHLKENPSYIAVSYTWGPPTAEAADARVTSSATHVIRCNGDAILITKNLYDFLQRVRCEPELNSQKFWVDSVCINQQDVAERGSQVSFMASIYRLADMVIAWLGEEDMYTEMSFVFIKTLGTLCADCAQESRDRSFCEHSRTPCRQLRLELAETVLAAQLFQACLDHSGASIGQESYCKVWWTSPRLEPHCSCVSLSDTHGGLDTGPE